MDQESLRACLESTSDASRILEGWRLRDTEGARANLNNLVKSVGLEAVGRLLPLLSRWLPDCPDPDMALNNLERLLKIPAGAGQLPGLLAAGGRGVEILIQLLSTSQYFGDLLVANPESIEMLRVPLRRSPSARELQKELQEDVDRAFEDSALLRAFRRFRQRHILRIGANDVIRERPLEEVTRDISRVAEAALEVALQAALKHLGKRFGTPHTATGQPARVVILAFGKLGGRELNYSSDIDLMFVYDEDGATRGPRGTSISNDEYFGRVTSEVVRLLSAHTEQGQAYRVDLRLRPEGQRGPLARSLDSTLGYYDTLGRTWERQALIKLRAVAGNKALGETFLQAIEPFVYRKYLGYSEITEIRLLKRRIEQKSGHDGTGDSDVKTGHGGIRDIEFVIQFLQLLNGGDLVELREPNTLSAMEALARVGCLTDQEYHILDDAYRYLRKVEHRLQLLFDLQTHRLPEGIEELRKLALRMGYGRGQGSRQGSGGKGQGSGKRRGKAKKESVGALEKFMTDYRQKTELDRRILDHLLHQAFVDESGGAEPETDLILDPNPEPPAVQAVLGRYGFRDVQSAYQHLTQLAQESVPFLSTRRCRHFLASIAPGLLRALGDTPDPDMALVNLEKVSASLGAKSVLWELFSFNPPSLKLYVDLCAWSQFLSDILINNPGMIDELLDSLVLNQPRARDELQAELAHLCRGAQDPEPILHSFKDKELLRIGVRDILGKESIQATTAALADLAETILGKIVLLQETALGEQYGLPWIEDQAGGRQSRYVLLGLGKLGGRELSYHSDLDLMLIYEDDGRTRPAAGRPEREHFESTDNFHYYTELAQRIIKVAGVLGPMGRLYTVDMRLRPTGKSGSLVLPLAEFRRYFAEGEGQLWERQALTRARVVHGEARFGAAVMGAVEEIAYDSPWRPEMASEIRTMRERLEASRNERDVKRGFGGIVDIEFLIQLLQLKYGHDIPELREPNAWAALEALCKYGKLSAAERTVLHDNYDFLRFVESRLRIVHNLLKDELPERSLDLEKLARRLEQGPAGRLQAGGNSDAATRFLREMDERTEQTRELFLQVVEREGKKGG